MEPQPQSAARQLADAQQRVIQLEQTLAECRASLADAQKDAEAQKANARAASEELQQFVYAASHDLQGPLRSIRTYSQLLEREYQSDAQAHELVAVIVDGTNTMDTLVRDLLNFSRVGNSPQLALVNLDSALQWALLKLADPVRETSATVNSAGLPEAYVDERQIATVFEQLIGNSLKYRGEAAPEIRITSEEDPSGYVVHVEDNGVGVSPEYHEQIFVPFKRLHGKKIPGSGLGLSICRKILRAHGGKIWLESDGLRGSTVTFTLPF